MRSASGTRQRLYCTRQSLCRVRHSVKHTRQKIDRQNTLCRVPRGHSAKKSDRYGAGPIDGHFTECQPCRHSAKIFYFLFFKFLCRVPILRALDKEFLYFFYKISLPSALCTTLSKDFYFFLISLPSVVTIALGKGVLCRVQHSAK